MTKDVLKYLQPNAVIPIDMETTTALVNALKERLAQEKALQALHDENDRLGLYKDAYAQPEPDELNIAYMSGLYDGKKKRPWVGLTVDELITLEQKHIRHKDLSRAIEAKIKENNTPQRTEPPQQKKVWTFWNLSCGDVTDAIKAKIKEKNR